MQLLYSHGNPPLEPDQLLCLGFLLLQPLNQLSLQEWTESQAEHFISDRTSL